MKNGFTLVELSIVLVIVGLLIGGLLVGQSLVESAKINAQVRQIQQFDIAANNFKQKFRQVPGDCNLIFNPTVSVSGDNDGFIEQDNGNIPSAGTSREPMLYFDHLSHSGQITEKYNFTNSGAKYTGKGRQFPIAKISNTNHGLTVNGNVDGTVHYFFGVSNPNGLGDASYTTLSPTGIMSAAKAISIEQKIDDGLPSTGNIASILATRDGDGRPYPFNLDTAANGCTTSGTAYNSANSNETACRLIVKVDLK